MGAFELFRQVDCKGEEADRLLLSAAALLDLDGIFDFSDADFIDCDVAFVLRALDINQNSGGVFGRGLQCVSAWGHDKGILRTFARNIPNWA
jgi:hypothetical protein